MVLIINQFVIISIHALREEGDELFYDAQEAYGIFLSTPSARRATRAIVRDHECRGFLSTPSARRATWRSRGPRKTPSNCYPRPPRGGRRRGLVFSTFGGVISIHALREEGDCLHGFKLTGHGNFYPRPPRGGRPSVLGTIVGWVSFLSTPSARRATSGRRADRGHQRISIHALREEGDAFRVAGQGLLDGISIHALREEGDRGRSPCIVSPRYFYPRPPRGGRRQKQRQNLYFLINYTTFCTNLEEL